jgi:aspartyl-tRNA synthetase
MITVRNIIELGNNITKLREEEYSQVEVSLEFMKFVKKAQHASSTDEATDVACQIVDSILDWQSTLNVFGYDKPDKEFLLKVKNLVFSWVEENCK